jgi:hypothetical protein
MPLVLLLIFGAFQIAFLAAVKILIDHAAYEAARTGAVHFEQRLVADRAMRVMEAIPRGPGFLSGDPDIELSAAGGSVRVAISAPVELLPFFRQTAVALGSGGRVDVSANVLMKKEPWLGVGADE